MRNIITNYVPITIIVIPLGHPHAHIDIPSGKIINKSALTYALKKFKIFLGTYIWDFVEVNRR